MMQCTHHPESGARSISSWIRAHGRWNMIPFGPMSSLSFFFGRQGYLQVIVAEAMQGLSKVLTGWRTPGEGMNGEFDCLSTFQHTPRTYPRPRTNSLWRNSFSLGGWWGLGYAPGVCWGSLRDWQTSTRCWFQVFMMFNPTWGEWFPFWRAYFSIKWVETTN